ncbi:uncharacterized protein LOC115963421 isoform X1 [Quercus lobata]|uniref:uncharacterized protein LOC115963421 isoform X1 n=1 Tax=Quercus lobata TaxID=97700 RepID=UPI0012471F8C|nr:uncharacterized protein LOC115963421 isoform X1 [Quercus lobata]XP_030938275.1 uncharacterized protein LOC115963421 isoform X1 [Quercus lobata]
MNSANTLIYTPFSLSQYQCHHHHLLLHISCSSLPPKRRRTYRRNPKLSSPFTTTTPTTIGTTSSSSDSSTLQTVIDLNQTTSFLHANFQRFISSSLDAYHDLRTLITLDDNRRILVSCRRSTVVFAGNLVLCSFVLVFAFRVLGKLGLWLIRGRSGLGDSGPVVVRRDRSLGGREVVVAVGVGRKVKERENLKRVSSNPLSPAVAASATNVGVSERVSGTRVRPREKKLPKWWPVSVLQPGLVLNAEQYQREANWLIQVITDNRINGRDIVEDDIIQLRQICRTSGVRVSFDTINTRDSFYRASVDFVLNVCSRAPSHCTSVQIDGEDARQFVAGLAENIGLENIRAAIIVSAAVAARTRSRFLQAWALEIQGKHAEAKLELSKICLMLRIFPPEESSPEMEMVARGLEKHLKVEQRLFLLNMLVGVCGEEGRISATEALGLVPSQEGIGDGQECKYT